MKFKITMDGGYNAAVHRILREYPRRSPWSCPICGTEASYRWVSADTWATTGCQHLVVTSGCDPNPIPTDRWWEGDDENPWHRSGGWPLQGRSAERAGDKLVVSELDWVRSALVALVLWGDDLPDWASPVWELWRKRPARAQFLDAVEKAVAVCNGDDTD